MTYFRLQEHLPNSCLPQAQGGDKLNNPCSEMDQKWSTSFIQIKLRKDFSAHFLQEILQQTYCKTNSLTYQWK